MKDWNNERVSDEVFHDQALLQLMAGWLAGRQGPWDGNTARRSVAVAEACKELANAMVKVRLP